MKQEPFAYEHGDDWNQQKISALEQRAVVNDTLLLQIATLLKIPAEAIKNFVEEAAVNIIGNTYNSNHTSTLNAFNHHPTFNPIDKIIELYEALVKSEKEKVELLQQVMDEKKQMILTATRM